MLKDLKTYKSAGEDGIISEFYILYRDIMKYDFFTLLQEIFDKNAFSKSQHKGVLIRYYIRVTKEKILKLETSYIT